MFKTRGSRARSSSRSRLNYFFFANFNSRPIQIDGGLCRLVLFLLAVNMFPMIYILSTSPNQWMRQRIKKSPQQDGQGLDWQRKPTRPGPGDKSRHSLGNKLILYANFPDYFKLEHMAGPTGLSLCTKQSPFRENISCELTTNVSRFNQSDAVVFYSHHRQRMEDFGFTPKKRQGQTWTFFASESPIYSYNKAFANDTFHKKINSTMTYRTDSDFFHGYIRTQLRRSPLDMETRTNEEIRLRQVFRKKTKVAAIFMSHCNASSGRDRYIRRLKWHMSLDVYGNCGTLKCQDRVKCDNMLGSDYKFYLAFENSNCVDYVTEKLLRVMVSRQVVPVVRGGADYSKLFPENSVIDTSRFSSAWHLAHYLNALAKDEDMWVRMFQWVWTWKVTVPQLPVCQYCYHLYSEPRPNHLYDNVYDWWHKGACSPPTDLRL